MNVAPPEPPKIELVKEDYNPIKSLQGPHSAHSIKARYENYTASYINDDQMATILIKHKDKTIAKLSYSAEFPGRTFTIDEAELEDWLDDQIGDGWGENGFSFGFFIGEPKEVYINNFYQVKKVYEPESLDWHWEKV